MGSRSDLPRRNSANAYRPVDDEGGLVVLPSRSEVKVLNPVASKVYSMLDGSHSRRQIVDAIVGEFSVSAEEAERDLDRFLEELDREGMLERNAPGPDGSAEPA